MEKEGKKRVSEVEEWMREHTDPVPPPVPREEKKNPLVKELEKKLEKAKKMSKAEYEMALKVARAAKRQDVCNGCRYDKQYNHDPERCAKPGLKSKNDCPYIKKYVDMDEQERVKESKKIIDKKIEEAKKKGIFVEESLPTP